MRGNYERMSGRAIGMPATASKETVARGNGWLNARKIGLKRNNVT
jgi:hypothetical protein